MPFYVSVPERPKDFFLSVWKMRQGFPTQLSIQTRRTLPARDHRRAFFLIEGQVQNSEGVVLIKAREIKPLPATLARSDAGAALVHESLVGSESHDFR